MKKKQIAEIVLAVFIAGFSFYHIFSWIRMPLLIARLFHDQVAIEADTIHSKASNAPITGFTNYPAAISFPALNTSLQTNILLQYTKAKNTAISGLYASIPDSSAYPNPINGNIVFFIANTNKNFASLRNLSKNAIVELHTQTRDFVYSIDRVQMMIDSTESFFNQTTAPTITVVFVNGDSSHITQDDIGHLLYYKEMHI